MAGKIIGKIVARIYWHGEYLRDYTDLQDPEKPNIRPRLRRLQFHSNYTFRPTNMPVLKIDPRLHNGDIAVVIITLERRKWYSIKKMEKINSTRVVVKTYKPSNVPDKAKYVVVFWGWPGATTKRGAYRDVEGTSYPERPRPLLYKTFVASSRNGGHWDYLLAYVGPAPLKIRYYRRTNLGNWYRYEYVFGEKYEERLLESSRRN